MGKGSESINFDDKVVITPVELYRDDEVFGDAYAVFAVMKSFGPRAEAKVGTYARRLSSKGRVFSEERVIKYQKMLQKAGWIVLLREGSDGNPRLWWMCRVKNERPPQQDESRGGETQPLQNTAPVKHRGSDSQGPRNTTPKQKKVLQAVEGTTNQKKREKPLAQTSSLKAGEALDRLSTVRLKSRYALALSPSRSNLDHAAQLETLLGPELEDVYRRYLEDPGQKLKDEKHPLGWLMPSLDSYRVAPKVAPLRMTSNITWDKNGPRPLTAAERAAEIKTWEEFERPQPLPVLGLADKVKALLKGQRAEENSHA